MYTTLEKSPTFMFKEERYEVTFLSRIPFFKIKVYLINIMLLLGKYSLAHNNIWIFLLFIFDVTWLAYFPFIILLAGWSFMSSVFSFCFFYFLVFRQHNIICSLVLLLLALATYIILFLLRTIRPKCKSPFFFTFSVCVLSLVVVFVSVFVTIMKRRQIVWICRLWTS